MDWHGRLLEWWPSGARLLAAQLQADPSFASEEDRVKVSAEQGDGCWATCFDHVTRRKPPIGVPKIVLANSTPPPDDPFDLTELLRRHGGPGRGQGSEFYTQGM